MQEKKLLRDALEEMRAHWRKWYPSDIFNGSSGDEGALEVVRLRKVMDNALASTTEETEMEKLRKWMKAELKRERGLLDIGDVGVEVAALNQCAVYESVLAYITTQFGEEEGDADSKTDV